MNEFLPIEKIKNVYILKLKKSKEQNQKRKIQNFGHKKLFFPIIHHSIGRQIFYILC